MANSTGFMSASLTMRCWQGSSEKVKAGSTEIFGVASPVGYACPEAFQLAATHMLEGLPVSASMCNFK